MRAVGREAAAKKYDLLSALMAHAMAGDQHEQRLVLRLMALITTRYNWQQDELRIGQREIARLWSVDERTVKREMARLRARGWITVKQQGARGRVSVLGLDLDRLMLDSRPCWPNIGPDFVARMTAGDGPVHETGIDDTGINGTGAGERTVVPFRKPASADAPAGGGPDPLDSPEDEPRAWDLARRHLAAQDRALYDLWIAGVVDGGVIDGGCQILIAPSRFHAAYLRTHLLARLQDALHSSAGITRLRIRAP